MHSFIQSFTGSLVHWLIYSLTHWFIDSLAHWFTGFLIHWVIALLLHWFTNPLVHWFIVSSVHWFMSSFTQTQLCTDSFMSFHWHLNNHLIVRWCTSQLQHFTVSASQNLSYRPLISYRQVLLSNFRPGACYWYWNSWGVILWPFPSFPQMWGGWWMLSWGCWHW